MKAEKPKQKEGQKYITINIIYMQNQWIKEKAEIILVCI